MARFEYMICAAQLMHLTFVNDEWQGMLPPNAAGALDTCPNLWDFLQEVGASGWELVAVNTTEEEALTTLYLKRQIG